MKKVITLLTAILLFQLSGFTQFPLYVFPMTVIGDTYADTLINTKALIVREGIKKIYAYQTQPEATKTFVSKTMYFNENGNIEKITACFGKKENITFCINDTLLYDNKGRMTEMKMFDSKDSLYMRSIA